MILELLGSSAFGVITGIFGNIINSYSSYKLQALKNQHDIAKLDADIRVINAESAAAIRVETAKTERELGIAELDALKESYKQADSVLFDTGYMQYLTKIPYLGAFAIFIITIAFAFIDFLKHSIRPFLTFYAIAASTAASYLCWKTLQLAGTTAITAGAAMDLFHLSIMFTFYMTSTIVGWWFADRRLTKSLNRIANDFSPSSKSSSPETKFTAPPSGNNLGLKFTAIK